MHTHSELQENRFFLRKLKNFPNYCRTGKNLKLPANLYLEYNVEKKHIKR